MSKIAGIIRLRHQRIFWTIICLILALAIGWLLYNHHANQVVKARAQRKSISQPNETMNKTMTAGGMKVPAAYQSKAMKLGYYCPSWDAKPGEISSEICIPLDK